MGRLLLFAVIAALLQGGILGVQDLVAGHIQYRLREADQGSGPKVE